jgi:tryptophan synthase alpha chain
MNRVDKLFKSRQKDILSVYFTAGYPSVDSTAGIIENLALAGVDMIEIGMPFSDPLADGPVIQRSSEVALKNGMNMKLLFKQLENIRDRVSVPLLLMGYLNPVVKFGMENFCHHCIYAGIDGVIIPDLPPEVYTAQYSILFEKNDLRNIFLIAPGSDNERVRTIDRMSRGFIYMVSSSSTTGMKGSFSREQKEYFKRIRELNLSNPLLIGFGISGNEAFREACLTASGVIVGSAFIKAIGEKGTSPDNIKNFIMQVRG